MEIFVAATDVQNRCSAHRSPVRCRPASRRAPRRMPADRRAVSPMPYAPDEWRGGPSALDAVVRQRGNRITPGVPPDRTGQRQNIVRQPVNRVFTSWPIDTFALRFGARAPVAPIAYSRSYSPWLRPSSRPALRAVMCAHRHASQHIDRLSHCC